MSNNTDDPKSPRQNISFEVRDEVIERIMFSIADGIKQGLPENMDFSLFLYGSPDPKDSHVIVFYVSSLPATDAVTLIKAWANRQTQ